MRLVLGVLAGYGVMVAFVMATFTLAYLAMGSERAFLPQSYQVSPLWILMSVGLGFVAAWLGGRISRRIAGSSRGPVGLALLVVVLGVALAVPSLTSPPDTSLIRETALSNAEAMRQAQTPPWMNVLNPLIGAIGVLLGGRVRG